jgi:hypothetical protein
MKRIIALTSLVVFCASAVWVEYKLVLYFGILCSLFATLSVAVGLLGGLLRAPEGYEGAAGFKVRVRRGEPSLARDARLSQLTRALKMDIARLFNNL